MFKKGDRVRVIDEDICGVIAFAKADKVTITTSDGFEFEYLHNELVLDQKLVEIAVPDILDRETESKKVLKSSRKNRNEPLVIDLHLHQITDQIYFTSNHEKLTAQINHIKTEFFKALDLKLNRLIIIHGVGSGKLRKEVHYFLEGQTGINFYDANYKLYGKGATEVEFYRH